MLTRPFRICLLRAQDTLQRLRREGIPPGQTLAQGWRTRRLCAFQLAGKGGGVWAGHNAGFAKGRAMLYLESRAESEHSHEA